MSSDYLRYNLNEYIRSRFNIGILRTTGHSRGIRMLVSFSPTKLTYQKPNRDQA